jgi:hypothetical protein
VTLCSSVQTSCTDVNATVVASLGLPRDYVTMHVRKGDRDRARERAVSPYQLYRNTASALSAMHSRLPPSASMERHPEAPTQADRPVVFIATDSAEVAASANLEPTGWDERHEAEERVAVRANLLSHDLSRPGTSAASLHMSSADRQADDMSMHATHEVVVDLLLLARGGAMCGMMGSVFYRVAVAMAVSSGRLRLPPIALDVSYEWPSHVNMLGVQREEEMTEAVFAPFVPSMALHKIQRNPAMGFADSVVCALDDALCAHRPLPIIPSATKRQGPRQQWSVAVESDDVTVAINYVHDHNDAAEL